MKINRCRNCGTILKTSKSIRCKTCANKWIATHRRQKDQVGAKHPRWKGGIMTCKSGGHPYVFVLRPDHPRAYRGYVKRADLVLEKKLGRCLTRNELAHHKDHNTLNDHPTNLEVMSHLEHMRLHQKEAVKARWPIKA